LIYLFTDSPAENESIETVGALPLLKKSSFDEKQTSAKAPSFRSHPRRANTPFSCFVLLALFPKLLPYGLGRIKHVGSAGDAKEKALCMKD
jgi:hypothetical protein